MHKARIRLTGTHWLVGTLFSSQGAKAPQGKRPGRPGRLEGGRLQSNNSIASLGLTKTAGHGNGPVGRQLSRRNFRRPT